MSRKVLEAASMVMALFYVLSARCQSKPDVVVVPAKFIYPTVKFD